MFNFGFVADFLHTLGSKTEIEVAVDGESKVGQLCTAAVVVEDKVLCQTGIGGTHIKILVGNTVDSLRTRNRHTGPTTIQVIHLAPHIEREGIPTGLVEDKDGISVVLYLRLLCSTAPSGNAYRIAVAYFAVVQDMRRSGAFDTLQLADKEEPVGKRLTILEVLGIEVDTVFRIHFLGFLQAEVGIDIIDGVLSVECTDHIDLVFGGRTRRDDNLEENGVLFEFKLRFLVLEHDFLFATTDEEHRQREHKAQKYLFHNVFHVVYVVYVGYRHSMLNHIHLLYT